MRFPRLHAAIGIALLTVILTGCGGRPPAPTVPPPTATPPATATLSPPTATATLPPPTATVTLPPPTVAPTTTATPTPALAAVTTVADGLVFPRGLQFGPDGSLYVAEAGSGGDTESMGDCADFTSPFAPYHIGLTARVSRIGPDGTRAIVADNLPSARHQFGDVHGVNDVAFLDGALYALVMGGGCTRGFADFPASVVRVHPDGTADIIADLSAFFVANPTAAEPEGDWEPDGSAYSMVAHDSHLYILNANHGDLDEIAPDGTIRRVVDFSASEGHITPTALTVHDGAFYVGNLGEYPIRVGAAKVFRVTPDGAYSLFADGLTAVLGLAFDAQGRLYALETSTVDNAFPQPASGRVVRRTDDGRWETVAAGLTFPTALTTGPDGALYVSQFGYGDDPHRGEVVRIDVTD